LRFLVVDLLQRLVDQLVDLDVAVAAPVDGAHAFFAV
jgi:hypothetical protein